MPIDRNTEAVLRLSVEGDQETTAKLRSAIDAQDDLTNASTQAKPAVENLTSAQSDLNAAEGDYFSILAQVNPQLGLFADLGLKTAKIVSGMGDGTISLAKAHQGLAGILGKNIGLLKAVGAAALVFGAVNEVIKAWEKMTEQIKDFNDELERTKKLQSDTTKTTTELTAAISAASARGPDPGFTREESRAVAQRQERLSEEFPELAPFIAEASLRLPPGTSREDLLSAAVNLQQGTTQLPEGERREAAGRRVATRRERRPEGELETILAGQSKTTARREAAAAGDIRNVLDLLPGPERSPEEIETLAKIISAIQEGDADVKFIPVLDPITGKPRETEAEDRLEAVLSAISTRRGIPKEDIGTTADIRQAEQLIPQIEAAARRARGGNVTINNVNTRTTAPSRGRDPIQNGETAGAALEEGF